MAAHATLTSGSGSIGSVNLPSKLEGGSDSRTTSSASFQNLDTAPAHHLDDAAATGTAGEPHNGLGEENSAAATTTLALAGRDAELEDTHAGNTSTSLAATSPTLTQAPAQLEDASASQGQPGQDAQAPGHAPEDQRTKLQTAVIIISLCAAVFLAALDVTIVTVAIPTISADFHSTAGYTWIGSAYLLANAAASPSWGKISDIWGRKPVLLTAVGVFWVGSLLAAVSVNMAMLIVARAVQGCGGGGILILVNVCISDLFSVRRRGMYLGIIGLVWALAGGFGPVLGGVFTSKATWRWCFYINLPISGLAMAVLFFSLKLHNPRTGVKEGLAAVDWLGSLTIVGGTLMVLLGLEFGGVTFPWKSPTVICLIVFGVVVAGLFFVVETKVAKFPVIPVRLFKSVPNMAVLGLCLCHGFVFISASYYLPLYFQGVLGATPLLSGVYVLPFTFVMGVFSAAAGFTIKKTGKYLPPIIAGFAFMTLGYGLFIDLDAYANWPKIIVYQIILGIGVGPNFQSPLIALQTTVQPRDIASATATYGFTRQIATSVSIVVGGVIFQNGMQKQHAQLVRELGPEVAGWLTGANAASSVNRVAALPEAQRVVAHRAYHSALRTMFEFYVAFAALGLAISPFLGSRTLSNQHTEHRTGLGTLKKVKTPARDEEKGSGGGGREVEAAGGMREESGEGREEVEVPAGASTTGASVEDQEKATDKDVKDSE